MKTNLPDATTYNNIHQHCICWSAVIAGALVAVGLSFLLQLFGIAIGLSAYHSTSTNASTLAIGGYVGLVVAAIVSMGVAGYVAGYLGRYGHFHPRESSIYGFLTWSLALLLSAFLIMPLAQYTSESNTRLSNVSVSSQMSQNLMVTKKTNPTRAEESTGSDTQVKMSPEALTSSFWLLFILFFIGAFSSCVGAYMGMNCYRRHHTVEVEVR